MSSDTNSLSLSDIELQAGAEIKSPEFEKLPLIERLESVRDLLTECGDQVSIDFLDDDASLIGNKISTTRVNVIRNGDSNNKVVLIVPRTLVEFLQIATEKLQMEGRADTVWNRFGFPISSTKDFLPEEVVYVGVRDEKFFGDKKPISTKLYEMCCCCRRRRATPRKRLLMGRQSSKMTAPNTNRFWADPDFDLSRSGLRKLFKSMDVTNTGAIDYREFQQGLDALELEFSKHPEFFNNLCKTVDIDHSGDITEEEFVQSMQALGRASKHFRDPPAYEKLRELFVYDYCPEHFTLRSTAIKQTLDEKKFFSEPPGPPSGESSGVDLPPASLSPPGSNRSSPSHSLKNSNDRKSADRASSLRQFDYKVRWININGHHFQSLHQISSIYDLSRLEIEDAMSLTERTRLVRHRGKNPHTQIILRMIALETQPPARVTDEQISIFVMEEHNTVITIQQEASDPVIFPLKRRIAHKGTKVRLNSYPFLVYSIIDSIVDYCHGAVYSFQQELMYVENKVHSPEVTPTPTLKDLYRINREISVIEKWVRPTEAVVNRLIELSGDELREYYLDVRDHLQEIQDRCTSVSVSCESLRQFYSNEQSLQQNSVMYILTLVTTVFIPAQFLTGLYGMNFDGEWSLPELHWKYGYILFWSLVLAGSITTLVTFRRRRWL